jgi:acetyl esterase
MGAPKIGPRTESDQARRTHGERHPRKRAHGVRRVALCLGAALLLAAVHSWAVEAGGQPGYTYKNTSHRALRLEVDYPPGWLPGDRRPAVVFFHGGGFKSGGPDHFARQGRYLADRGMVSVRPEYRLTPEGVEIPDCLEDAISAMRWVRRNAEELGVDPDRIAVGGGSAGGYLAAALATTRAEFMVEHGLVGADDDRGVSFRPNALLLYNPFLDFDDPYHLKVLDAAGRKSSESRFTPLYQGISPYRNMTANLPPTLIQFGSRDNMYFQQLRWIVKSRELGVPITYHVYEAETHGWFVSSPHFEYTTLNADAFLRSIGWLDEEPVVELPYNPPAGNWQVQRDKYEKKRDWDKVEETLHGYPREHGIEVIPHPSYRELELVYKVTPQRPLRLVVDFPPGWQIGDRRPAMVWIHGGRFRTGSMNDYREPSRYFADRGVVCYRLEYRIETVDGTMPHVSMEDAISAMRWIRKRAVSFGVDPDRIVTIGGSAGGHLASALWMTDPEGMAEAGFVGVRDDRRFSPKPNAMVLFNPFVDFFDPNNEHNLENTCPRFGEDPDALRPLYHLMSPIEHMSADQPPSMITFGTRDAFYPQQLRWIADCRKLGVRCTPYVYKGEVHGWYNWSPHYEHVMANVDRFLQDIGYLETRDDVDIPHRPMPDDKVEYMTNLYEVKKDWDEEEKYRTFAAEHGIELIPFRHYERR